MHLNGEIDTQLDDFETIRKRKALKIKEAARLRGEEDMFHSLVPEVKHAKSRVKKKVGRKEKVVNGGGHIVRLPPEFCETGGDEVGAQAPLSPTRQNISHTGSWLDRRAFASINTIYYGEGAERRALPGSKGAITEGDRIFLRRCKDVLNKRFGNIQLAWRKLDANNSESVSLTEFVATTSALFKAYEARLLYRLMDQNSDGNVTIRELQSLLDSA
jgi:hypothetical protein